MVQLAIKQKRWRYPRVDVFWTSFERMFMVNDNLCFFFLYNVNWGLASTYYKKFEIFIMDLFFLLLFIPLLIPHFPPPKNTCCIDETTGIAFRDRPIIEKLLESVTVSSQFNCRVARLLAKKRSRLSYKSFGEIL